MLKWKLLLAAFVGAQVVNGQEPPLVISPAPSDNGPDEEPGIDENKPDYRLGIRYDGCVQWSREGQCRRCSDSRNYEIYGGVCTKKCLQTEYRRGLACISVFQRCITWFSKTRRCYKCKNGYEQTPGGECIPSREHCQNWNFAYETCGQCQPGFAAVGDRCLVSCAQNEFVRDGVCLTVPEGCLRWKKDKGCLICKDYKNFFAYRGLCIPRCASYEYRLNLECFPKIKGCNQWDEAGLRCLGCNQEYEYLNGICVQRCQRGEQRVNTICIPLQRGCLDLECTACEGGFELQGQKCVPVRDDNCKVFNAELQFCQQCLVGYFIGPNAVCMPSPEKCDEQSEGLCQACVEGLVLTDGKCRQQCGSPMQFIANNICIPVPSQCSGYTMKKGCTGCIDRMNFALVDGICVKRCLAWQYRSNGVCTNVSPKCQAWQSNTPKCLVCKPGFKLDNEQCF